MHACTRKRARGLNTPHTHTHHTHTPTSNAITTTTTTTTYTHTLPWNPSVGKPPTHPSCNDTNDSQFCICRGPVPMARAGPQGPSARPGPAHRGDAACRAVSPCFRRAPPLSCPRNAGLRTGAAAPGPSRAIGAMQRPCSGSPAPRWPSAPHGSRRRKARRRRRVAASHAVAAVRRPHNSFGALRSGLMIT